jgi:hypothetical protein
MSDRQTVIQQAANGVVELVRRSTRSPLDGATLALLTEKRL